MCCILTFDPAKYAIPKWCTGRKWHIPMAVMRRNRVGGLGWKMGQGKIPWYTLRLMHRNRVTCELHESYFRLMTIKHAIPKIEWAIELLYSSVKTGSQLVRDQMCWRPDVVGRANTQQKGPSGLPFELEIRWVRDKMRWRKPSSSRELSPRASSWASGERERYNADGHKNGGQYTAVLFDLQLPLTHKPFK